MLRRGNTDINALGNNINKAYLGTIEVFCNVFVSLWETTTASETITLPTPTNYRVDWGDGTVTTNTNSHEYLVANQYTIKISGDITDFAFNNGGDKTKILEVSNFSKLQMISSSFNGCGNLDITATDIPIINNSLLNVLKGCGSLLFNTSLNNWDVGLVTTFAGLFENATLFNQPINNWVTTNLVTLTNCFRTCANFNQNVDSWDVSSVTSVQNCFQNTYVFNLPLNNWDTSSVNNMIGTFRNSGFNLPLNNWDTSSVTKMLDMWRGSLTKFNQDLSIWDFSSVTNIDRFMQERTNTDYDATHYDNLLIKWDNSIGGLVFANMVDVNIGMGTIKYTTAGASARASLISKGFIITDGGQI